MPLESLSTYVLSSNFIANALLKILLALPYAAFPQNVKGWIAGRDKRWLFGGSQPTEITFSMIKDHDDEKAFSSKRVLVHLGDALALSEVRLALAHDLHNNVTVKPEGVILTEGKNYVHIGGPVFNPATKELFSRLPVSWHFPFRMEKSGDLWCILNTTTPRSIEIGNNRDVIHDYGLIARLPHPNVSNKRDKHSNNIVLAGLSSFGTQAAAHAALDTQLLNNIRQRLKQSDDANCQFFCAVVSVKPRPDRLGIELSTLKLEDAKPLTKLQD